MIGIDNLDLAHVCAEDPGERTFVTWYDLWNGVIWHIGDGLSHVMDTTIGKKIRHAQSQLGTDVHTSSYIQNLWNRKKRVLKTFHRSTAHLATSLFGLMIRPDFRTKNMTNKERRLSAAISRRMLSLGHHAFKIHLTHRCKQTGTIIHVCNEAFTSKICGTCAFYHKKLGKAKTFHCPACNTAEMRDGGASRKILLKTVINCALEFSSTSGTAHVRVEL
jgi:transposase